MGMSLNQRINLWRLFVESVSRGYPESAYEYCNDLSNRDLIAAMVQDRDVGDSVIRILNSIDAKFLAATREAPRPVRTFSDPNSWWWQRIPKVLVGELLTDLVDEGLIEIP